MKIRGDLIGVVLVQTDAGLLTLAAGDVVPDGVSVGNHVLADQVTEPAPVDAEPIADDLVPASELDPRPISESVAPQPRRRGRPPKNRGPNAPL
ncbi:hypothetical protein NONI108955_10985 [Nocardia ninae]|uniref:Uncharacterized protein n=1 Tax=Nocardia ninae NBRC 108245 TaxID=1210091 RepID=A0A511MMY6_9NOCA|nr:hypothetical protein NN4_64920 [Nocardia ninae NBRC 108245]